MGNFNQPAASTALACLRPFPDPNPGQKKLVVEKGCGIDDDVRRTLLTDLSNVNPNRPNQTLELLVAAVAALVGAMPNFNEEPDEEDENVIHLKECQPEDVEPELRQQYMQLVREAKVHNKMFDLIRDQSLSVEARQKGLNQLMAEHVLEALHEFDKSRPPAQSGSGNPLMDLLAQFGK